MFAALSAGAPMIFAIPQIIGQIPHCLIRHQKYFVSRFAFAIHTGPKMYTARRGDFKTYVTLQFF